MNNKNTKPKHHFWRGKILPKLALTIVPLPKNTFCSIDVTNKCNLRCKHCYFFSYEQDKKPELTIEEWLQRIQKMQKGRSAFFSCTWVGGEPLLRKELVEKGRKFFKANRVVTNGTLPLPDWKDVEFHVSIDGTEEIHDSIRGMGCYEKIKTNLASDSCPDINVAIACCLNRSNVGSIEDLIKEWKKVPHVRHILFDFFTPIRGVKEDLWLTFEERDSVLDKLQELKSIYGDFIGGPPKTFDLMKEKNKHKAVGAKCVFVNNGTAFDAWGNMKKPCVIGPKADCDKCGCIVPFSLKAWKMPSNLLREIWKDIRNAVIASPR
ncbi:MAG: radical SAM protein [Pseudomonadota bacterium]